jgi:hypothetical protein
MNVATITMDPDVARRKLKAYRSAKHRDAEEHYKQAAIAYAALAKGTPLIRLTEAIQQGGFFEDMRPKLAIARADRPEVRFRWSDGSMAEYCSDFDRRIGRAIAHGSLNVNMGRAHGLTVTSRAGHTWTKTIQGYALVPMVPADVRPEKGQLKDRFILWEVEHWSDRSQTAKAPIDPLLLQHVGGDLYAVLAQWDLSPIEQAILEGAMRS